MKRAQTLTMLIWCDLLHWIKIKSIYTYIH